MSKESRLAQRKRQVELETRIRNIESQEKVIERMKHIRDNEYRWYQFRAKKKMTRSIREAEIRLALWKSIHNQKSQTP